MTTEQFEAIRTLLRQVTWLLFAIAIILIANAPIWR